MKPNRRTFLITSATALSALAASGIARAQPAPKAVTEADPVAQSLGYREDSTKVDQAKYPAHQASQVCAGCSFYNGKPTEARGPCNIFNGATVNAKGWCSAYAKKA